LETKWGTIKHDVAKFIGVYNQVVGCRELRTSLDDVLQRALELYKNQAPEAVVFCIYPLLAGFEGCPPLDGNAQ
jgi:hypothetical protein